MGYDVCMDKLKQYIKEHGTGDLARKVGVTLQCVRDWKNGAYKPLPGVAIRIEHATEGAVTRHDLYPDLWPPA